MTSAYELAYLAGLFDGEGTILFNCREKRGVAPVMVVRCSVKMTDEDPVRSFHQIWGGGMRYSEHANPRWHPTWTWSVDALRAKAFLEDIAPHLRVKRAQALLALDYYTTVNQGRVLSAEEIIERAGFRDRMRELNRSRAQALKA